jgi:tRNA A-37 threonylcarbamoyl transferase component Bud32/uncharacterized protein (DUF433 family)
MSNSPTQGGWRQRIVTVGGTPVVSGCGVRVVDCLRELAAVGPTELVRRHPGLSEDDVRACLLFAADSVAAAPLPTGQHETVTLPPAPEEEAATLAPPAADEAATLAPSLSIDGVSGRVAVPGYEVLSELGRGGMGVVYKARHVRLNRVVALKMILAGEHAGEEARSRFQTEAEAVARLQHPGIVQVFEVGEHDGHSFLALEFVEGGSLASRLSEEPWPPKEAAALVEKLARAVQAAHDKGIVHRDLKPENVLLTADGEPKVTDFGLAKKLEADGKTQTGAVMGTPSYMAPEQAAGRKDIGPAADVYALGGVLYRLLVGRPAFEGPTTLDVLMRVLEDEPTPPRHVNKKCPRDLATVALKCLHKEPGRRYDSAAELADDLRRFQDGEPIRARRVTWAGRARRWAGRNPGLAALRIASALVALAFSAFFLFLSEAPYGAVVPLLLLTLTASVRGHARAMVLGGSASALVVVLALAFGYFFGSGMSADAYFLLAQVLAPPGKLVLMVCLFPPLAAVAAGAAARERLWVWLLGCLLLLLTWSLEPTLRAPILGCGVVTLAFALMCRGVRWWIGGDVIDVCCGSVLGLGIGAVLSNIAGDFLMFASVKPGTSFEYTHTVHELIIFGGSLLGALTGAVVAAFASRRRSPAA